MVYHQIFYLLVKVNEVDHLFWIKINNILSIEKKKIIWNVTQGGVIDGSASQQGPPSNFAVGGNEASSASSGDTTDDDGFSQAESSIKNGEVIASAQGNKWNK